MYTHDGEDVFVIDGHIHFWDANEQNVQHEGGEHFIKCFYDYHTAFTPEEEQWDLDTYRKYEKERMVQDLFRDGYVDMGIFQPTYLSDFYAEGFNTTDQNAELAEEYPERFVLNGSFGPRDGDPLEPDGETVEAVLRDARLAASNVEGQGTICASLHESRNGVSRG